MASKLAKILKGLAIARESLELLDSVVDVDRLIGISNAQGPQAKIIKQILNTDLSNPHAHSQTLDEIQERITSLPQTAKKEHKALPSKKRVSRKPSTKG